MALLASMILSNFGCSNESSSKDRSRFIGEIKDSFTAQLGILELVFKPLVPVAGKKD